MGLPFCRGRRGSRGRRTVHNTYFWKNGFFQLFIVENYPVDFHDIFRVC